MALFGRPVLTYGQVARICSFFTVGLFFLACLLSNSLLHRVTEHVHEAYASALDSQTAARAYSMMRAPWQQWDAARWEQSVAVASAAAAAAAAANAGDGNSSTVDGGGGGGISEEMVYLNYLVDRYSLTPDIPWFARRIRADYDASGHGRPSLTQVLAKFLPHGFVKVHTSGPVEEDEDGVAMATDPVGGDIDSTHLPIETTPLLLPMGRSARPDEIDASSLLFGISTTYARLSYDNFSLAADWARWLTDGRGHSNGASLFLSLHRPKASELDGAWRVLQDYGIDVHVYNDTQGDAAIHLDAAGAGDGSESVRAAPAAVRYANLISLLQEHDKETLEKGGPGRTHPTSKRKHISFRDRFRGVATRLRRATLPEQSPAPASPGSPGAEKPEDALQSPDSPDKAEPTPATQMQHQRTGSGRKGKAFYALVDDDFFVPSMDKLLSKLTQYAGAHHPHSSRGDELWLGFPSDRPDWEAVKTAMAGGATSRDEDNGSDGDAAADSMMLTYGGGAVFLAPPLAARVAELPCLRRTSDALDAALHTAMAAAGGSVEHWDEQLYRCISTHTPARLRVVPSLFAPSDEMVYRLEDDVSGSSGSSDSSGSSADVCHNHFVRQMQQYDGGLQPLTLHRYRFRDVKTATQQKKQTQTNKQDEQLRQLRGKKQQKRPQVSSRKGKGLLSSPPVRDHHYGFPAGAGHRATSACGEDCFLQRFVFRDDWVLVNGYSLTHYAEGMRPEPLKKAAVGQPSDGGFSGLIGTIHSASGRGGRGGGATSGSDSGSSSSSSSSNGVGRGLLDTVIDSFRDHYINPPSKAPALASSASRALRRFQQQQLFWSGKKLVVEEPEGRPDDVSIVTWRGVRRTWRLLDARTAADGSVWQAYVKRRRGGAAGSGIGLDDDADEEDDMIDNYDRVCVGNTHETPSAEDSVIVLIWETQKE